MTATLALASEPAAVAGDPTTAKVLRAAEILLLDIQVLGRPLQGIFEVERAVDGHLIMPADAWSQARLRPTSDAVAMANGQSGYALDAVPGLTYEVDQSQLILKIRAPAAAFDASTVEIYGRPSPALADAAPGAYLDYEASVTHAGERNSFGALVEGVVFNGGSALVAGAVIRRDDRQTEFVRTDTYWRKDFPQRMEVLVVGDALGSGGLWSVPVRFGGIRFARDFSQAPGFITYPIPSISGEAGLPSTVDVLINNQVSASTSVPAGPFALTNVPMMNGAGEMQVVVRDLLGRETLIQQSYYVAPQLLSRDLSDFAFDAGAMRAQYGTASNDYGPWFGAATYRRGISDWLTGELRAEMQHDRQAAGAGINLLSGQIGVISAAAAYAKAGDEQGGRYLLGFQRGSAAGGLSLMLEHSDRGYQAFGSDPMGTRPKDQLVGSAGLGIGRGMFLGVSYISRTTWIGDRFTLAGASFSMPLTRNAFLSLSAGKELQSGGGWYGSANLIVPLSGLRTLAASSNRSGGRPSVNAIEVTQSLPSGPGWGWNVNVSDDSMQRVRAAAGYNSNFGQLTAQASQGSDRTDLRLGAGGSFGWFSGLAFATRRINQGAFAVVHVADVAGVPVLLSNQVVAVTNEHGLALVPHLLPYQSNQLTIHPDELPLGVEIRGVQMTVAPLARSGVLVDFPVRQSRAALVVLHDADGVPVPAGARVMVLPGHHEFVVFRRGEAYLMDLEDDSRIEVRWNGGGCDLSLPLVPAAPSAQAPRIGPLTCAGTQ